MIKIISLCLCIAILASGAAYALASGKDKAEMLKQRKTLRKTLQKNNMKKLRQKAILSKMNSICSCNLTVRCKKLL